MLTKGEKGTKRYLAHHVILATGGAGALYSSTSNFPTNTGDGIALAFRAGAPLVIWNLCNFTRVFCGVK